MIKHPPKEKDIDFTLFQHPIMYSDYYMQYPIGDVVKYWTKYLLKNGILIDNVRCDKNGFDGSFFRPYHKSFPYNVNIIHMDFIKESVYKINFNFPDYRLINYTSTSCTTTIDSKNINSSYTNQQYVQFFLTESERKIIEDYFSGSWLDYLNIQGSRIIVQFDLDEYYIQLFRTQKLLKIKDKLQESKIIL